MERGWLVGGTAEWLVLGSKFVSNTGPMGVNRDHGLSPNQVY